MAGSDDKKHTDDILISPKIDAQGKYKRRGPFPALPQLLAGSSNIDQVSKGTRNWDMHPQVLACTFAVLSAACHMDAYPMFPESEGVKDFVPTDFNLADSAVGFIPDNTPSTGLRHSRSLNSAFSALEEGMNQVQKAGHWKGGKETLPEDASTNLVKDIKTILWKLAAAEQLQSQGFTKSDQLPQKPSKRACFWKYCVTN